MSDRKAYLLTDEQQKALARAIGIALPLVETPENRAALLSALGAIAPIPTAQEMYWALWERTRELNAQGFPHLQALAMAFGNYIDAHPEIEQPKE